MKITGTEIKDSQGNVVNDLTIKCTLVIPYAETNGRNESGQATTTSTTGDYKTNFPAGNKNYNYTYTDSTTGAIVTKTKHIDVDDQVKSIVKLVEDSHITVKGVLEISGVLSGGNGGGRYAGHTAGAHARLVMEDNSTITCEGGEIKCFGYIHESSENNGSAVNVTSGSLYQPFVLRDFKGGSLMGSLLYENDPELAGESVGGGIGGIIGGIIGGGGESPMYSYFNQFQFINVHPTVTYSGSGSMKSYANLYAKEQENYTLGSMVGFGSDSFIQLNSGASLTSKYSNITDITTLSLSGGANTNELSLSIANPFSSGKTITVSSGSFVFALSWLYDITLTNGSYSMQQKYKMMPGSKLTVDSTASLNILSLNVYNNSFRDTIGTGQYPHLYPESSSKFTGITDSTGALIPSALLTVNGTLIANELGGNVISTNPNGAVVEVTETTTVTTNEATVAGTLSIEQDQQVTNNLKLQFQGKNDIELSSKANANYSTSNGQWSGTYDGDASTDDSGGNNPCVTPDTLITLADGTQKEIQYVTDDDIFIVWDFFKGEFAYVPGAVLINHGEGIYTIITLTFDDGTVLKVVGMHGLYSKDLNDWVYIDKDNVESFVGTTFINTDGESLHEIKLIDYTITEEYTTAYSMFTALHYNCFFENILTLTPSMFDGENYYIPFEIGEGMKYDEEKMKEDIETYGLYTYEDFAEHVTYEQFVGFNAAYFKVSVGKGLVTYEQLIESIYSYVNPDS